MNILRYSFALQSSIEGIDTEFKSARGDEANTQGGTIVLIPSFRYA
jgi:hypothetical protein